jgi:MFS family permease
MTLVILVMLNVISLMDRKVISLLVGPIKADLGLSDIEFGLVQGVAFSLLYCVAGLPLGWLADRFARRWIIWGGVTVWSIGSMASGLAGSFGQLFTARVAVGVGEAALQPSATAIIANLFPRSRLSLAFGLFTIGATLGGGLAFALGGILLSHFQDHPFVLPRLGELPPWRAVLIVLGAPGLLLALAALLCREPPRAAPAGTSETGPPAERFRDFLKRRRALLIRHFLGFPVLGTVVYGVGAWLPAYFDRAFGWEPHEIGVRLGLMSVVVASIWALATGVIIDRLFSRGVRDAHFIVHIVQAVVGAPICIAAFLADNGTLAFTLLLIGYPIFQNFAAGALASLQLVTPPQMRSRISALYVFALTGVGVSVGPLLVALVTDLVLRDEAKVGTAMAIVMGLLTSVALVSLWSGRRALREAIDSGPEAGSRLPTVGQPSQAATTASA